MERLLKRREVETTTGLSRATIYCMMSEGRFPGPLRIGTHAVAWRASDIQRWIDGLEPARAPEAAAEARGGTG